MNPWVVKNGTIPVTARTGQVGTYTYIRYHSPNREIVRLRIEGYEVGEIVTRTGRSARTVERVLQKFRALLADP